MLDKLDRFHNTKLGNAVFALFGLVVIVLVGSAAIDSGNWYDYLIVILAVILTVQNLARLIAGFIKKGKRS